jgi:general secretion pathway protein G
MNRSSAIFRCLAPLTAPKIPMKRSLRSQAGFTLLEIMLVVAIIVLLLASAIYMMAPQLNIAKAAKAQGDIQTMKTALMTYEMSNGSAPSTAQGLQALVTRPEGQPVPRMWIQGMDALPMDPWGNPYYYENPGKHNPKGYDLYSAGPDRQPGTDDDIGNWQPSQ